MKKIFKKILPFLGLFFLVIVLTSIMDVEQFRNVKTWLFTFDYSFHIAGVKYHLDIWHICKNIVLLVIFPITVWYKRGWHLFDKIIFEILIIIIAVISHEYILHSLFKVV